MLCFSSLFLVGCEEQAAHSVVNVSGSTTILPIAEVAAENFHKDHNEVRVLVSGMGSSAGIEAVASGTADIGTVSRNLRGPELDLGLNGITVAYDGIAVIVNNSNPVKELSSEDLKAIFEGKIRNWKELGGEDLTIDLINRDEASGTREAFQSLVMKSAKFDEGAVVLPGTGQVREVVRRTPGAIGYISIGFVNADVEALAIDGVAPLRANVSIGRYPISRSLYFFTEPEISDAAQDYIDYVLSDAVQFGAVVDAGYIPIRAEAGGE